MPISKQLHKHMNQWNREHKKLLAQWDGLSEEEQAVRMRALLDLDLEWMIHPESERIEAMDFYHPKPPPVILPDFTEPVF